MPGTQASNQPPLRPLTKRAAAVPRIVGQSGALRRRPNYAVGKIPGGRTPALRALVAIVVAVALGLLIYLITLSSHPSISGITPAPGSTSPAGPVTIAASLSSNAAPIQRLVFILDGHQVVPAVHVDGAHAWTMDYQGNLDKGEHTAKVEVFDSDGHETEHHWTFTASGRLIAPSIVFSEPAAGSVLAPGPFRLTARFTADSAPTGMTVLLDGQPIPSTVSPATGISSGVHVWTITATPELDPGGHQIELRAASGEGRVTAATLDLAASQDESRITTRYFSDRGLYVSGPFLAFWLQGGHDKIFGEPASPQFVAPNGVTTQYFDTERLELNKNGTVGLGLLGQEVLKAPQQRVDAPGDLTGRYFSTTGHTLSGRFLIFWKTYGGLGVFGYPISEPIDEGGNQVQYFERAKLELAVSSSGGGLQVHMVPLGAQLWRQHGTGG